MQKTAHFFGAITKGGGENAAELTQTLRLKQLSFRYLPFFSVMYPPTLAAKTKTPRGWGTRSWYRSRGKSALSLL
jgi:hypothetical protein